MAGDSRCRTFGEMGYNTPLKDVSKRPHQWLSENMEPQFLCNKKQGMEPVKSLSRNPQVNFSLWENSSFEPDSGQLTDHLFGDSITNPSLSKKKTSSLGGASFSEGDSHTICLITTTSTTDDGTLSVPSSGDGIDPTYKKADVIGSRVNKEDGNFTLMGHEYNKGFNSILSMGQSFIRGDEEYILMDQQYQKGDNGLFLAGPASNKGLENFISMGNGYTETNEPFGPLVAHTSDKRCDARTPDGPISDNVNVIATIPSVNHNYNKGTGISFGRVGDSPQAFDHAGNTVNSYDQSISQSSNEQKLDNSVIGNANQNVPSFPVTPVSTSKAKASSRKKAQKKIPPNSFPVNVISMLATGILDGVPVKYVSISREKELGGIIKGPGYLCACKDCNLSTVLNSIDFERHAGCKTKHPNTRIYFESGKSIYAVAQELKSTSQELLFDLIQTITGSPINQKNFNTWKASYLAATRELQRIYGAEAVSTPS